MIQHTYLTQDWYNHWQRIYQNAICRWIIKKIIHPMQYAGKKKDLLLRNCQQESARVVVKNK